MEIGTDIEKVARFKLAKNSPFLNTHFTKNELEYAYSHTKPEMHLCGFFCAKEAVNKTLSKSVLLKNIEVSHEKSGRPLVKIKGKKDSFLLSISHCEEYAVAFVVREGKK